MSKRWWATGSQRERRKFWDEQPLGNIPDRVLAERLGVTTSLVGQQRRKRGICAALDAGVPPGPNPSRRPRDIDWDSQPLGEVSDEEIARRLGVGSSTVGRKRQERGIPPLREDKASKGTDYSNVPLGRIPDAEIAEALGLDARSVADARKRRGIPACKEGYHRRVLRKRGMTLASLYMLPLGDEPDREIAQSTRLPVSTIKWARRRAGIPGWRSKSADINWDEQPLGDIPDVDLATTLGVSHSLVAKARIRRGIAAWSPEHTCVMCGYLFRAPLHYGARHGGPKYCSSNCLGRSKYLADITRGFPPQVRVARKIIYDVNSGLFWLRKQMREET